MNKTPYTSTVFPAPSKNQLQFFGLETLTVKYQLKIFFLGVFAILPFTLVLPAEALQVLLTPSNPELGDTLAVIINLSTPDNSSNPVVNLGGRVYPSFAVAPHQYRAFIPTSPSERPGIWLLTVYGDAEVQTLSVHLRNRPMVGSPIYPHPESKPQRVDTFRALPISRNYWHSPNVSPITTSHSVRRYPNGEFVKNLGLTH